MSCSRKNVVIIISLKCLNCMHLEDVHVGSLSLSFIKATEESDFSLVWHASTL